MLLLILKVALLVFIVCGAAAIVTVYIIRRRKTHFREPLDTGVSLRPWFGGVPPTPLPEWVHWDELDSEDPDEAPSARR